MKSHLIAQRNRAPSGAAACSVSPGSSRSVNRDPPTDRLLASAEAGRPGPEPSVPAGGNITGGGRGVRILFSQSLVKVQSVEVNSTWSFS